MLADAIPSTADGDMVCAEMVFGGGDGQGAEDASRHRPARTRGWS